MNEKPEQLEDDFNTETFKKKPPPPDDSGVHLKDFVAYMQSHDYIYLPAGDFWPAERVNARISTSPWWSPRKASTRQSAPASGWPPTRRSSR